MPSPRTERHVEPLFRTVVRPYRLGPLLLTIARRRLTGHLLLSSDMVERTIHFHAGYPVFSSSTQFGERLGPIAVRMELITREQLARALATARSRELELGRALVSLGLVSGAQLFAVLGEQLVQQVGAAHCTGARARFFADRRDGLPMLRLHPMTGVMAAVRTLAEPERKQLVAALGPRTLISHELPDVVRGWLGEVGFQDKPDELLNSAATFGQLCSRLGVRMQPGALRRSAPPEQTGGSKRPGRDAATLGAQSRRKISSMQMLAAQSPPLDADAAELIALSLVFAGSVELMAPEPTPKAADPAPRALSAEEVLAVLDRPDEQPMPELDTVPPADDELGKMLEAYLFAPRAPDVAARMAVWGPGLEATEAQAELLGTYLSVVHDTDPYRVLGVDSRGTGGGSGTGGSGTGGSTGSTGGTGGTIEQMRDAQLARLAHAADAPILTRAKAAELRQCVELAYQRLSLMLAPAAPAEQAATAPTSPTPPGTAQDMHDASPGAAARGPGAGESDRRAEAAREAKLVEEAQRMMFAGDYRQLKALLGPAELADTRAAPLRLAYALACNELERGDARGASVERAQRALAELMADGRQRTSALGLWSVGHRTQGRDRAGLRIFSALLLGAAIGYAAAQLF